MTWPGMGLILFGIIPLAMVPAYGQDMIQIEDKEFCLKDNNLTMAEKLKACGIKRDWLQFTVIGWEWLTGGLFSILVLALLIGLVYAATKSSLYTLLVGTAWLPAAWSWFPSSFLYVLFIMIGVYVVYAIWQGMLRRTGPHD